MFDVGLLEILLILVVALIVIGPDRLPEVARGLGKAFRVLRKLFDEVKGVWDGIADIPEPQAKPVAKTQAKPRTVTKKKTTRQKATSKNGRSK